jgi:hypothetical protein
LWGGRKLRNDSRRIETKRKFWEEAKDTSFVGREKEHLVRRFPGNARSSAGEAEQQ